MMENSPTNMMFADRDFVITYMNPASLETLTRLEEHLPVKAADVVGSSLDVFHKTPAYQRGILADDVQPAAPGEHQRSARRCSTCIVSAIPDEDGEYIGAMATWEVVTEKLADERRPPRGRGRHGAVEQGAVQAGRGDHGGGGGAAPPWTPSATSSAGPTAPTGRSTTTDQTAEVRASSPATPVRSSARSPWRRPSPRASASRAAPGRPARPVLHRGHRRDDRLRPGAGRPEGRREVRRLLPDHRCAVRSIGTMDFFATETLHPTRSGSTCCATSAGWSPGARAAAEGGRRA